MEIELNTFEFNKAHNGGAGVYKKYCKMIDDEFFGSHNIFSGDGSLIKTKVNNMTYATYCKFVARITELFVEEHGFYFLKIEEHLIRFADFNATKNTALGKMISYLNEVVEYKNDLDKLGSSITISSEFMIREILAKVKTDRISYLTSMATKLWNPSQPELNKAWQDLKTTLVSRNTLSKDLKKFGDENLEQVLKEYITQNLAAVRADDYLNVGHSLLALKHVLEGGAVNPFFINETWTIINSK